MDHSNTHANLFGCGSETWTHANAKSSALQCGKTNGHLQCAANCHKFLYCRVCKSK